MHSNKLLLDWYSPFGPETDIGAFSRNILRHIAVGDDRVGLDARLVIEPNGACYRPPCPFRLIEEPSFVGEAVPVFNIGNNRENHFHINTLARQQPGIVIVHDIVMHPFVVWEALENRRKRLEYIAALAEEGGLEALDWLEGHGYFERSSNGARPWETVEMPRFPLLKQFIREAAGLVVHSEYAETQVRRLTDRPICRLYLPTEQKPFPTEAEWDAWVAATATTGRVEIVSFGHMTENKCLERLVHAFLGSEPLKAQARLTLVGHPRDAALAERLKAMLPEGDDETATVRLVFSVSEPELDRLKAGADIFVLLRQPNFESGSGALLEGMNMGRPVVTYDSGDFGEIPTGASVQLPLGLDGEALADALLALVEDPARRVELGRAARAFRQERSTTAYLDRLAGFIREVVPSMPALAALPRRKAPDNALEQACDALALPELTRFILWGRYGFARQASLYGTIEAVIHTVHSNGSPQSLRKLVFWLDYLLGSAPRPPDDVPPSVARDIATAIGPRALLTLDGPLSPIELRSDIFAARALAAGAAMPGEPRPIERMAVEPVTPGQVIDLAQGDWQGRQAGLWYAPEKRGAWSKGRVAFIPLALAEEVDADKPYGLEVSLYTPARGESSATTISIDGVRCDPQEPPPAGDWSFVIPLPANRHNRWLVAIDAGQCHVPSEEGHPGDDRVLGAHLRQFRIIPLASA